jgi:arylamine N-acetyltransferase
MTAPSPSWVSRYLALLGVEHAAPGLESLRRLVRAQVLTVPFENSGSLLRRQAAGTGPVPPLDAEALLTAWEERRAGGVCFEHTEAFGRLLAELGYAVTPIAGEISFPGSHQALVVEAGGARWLLDVGEGSPFFEPIPLDRTFEVRRAGLGFRFGAAPGDAGGWLLERALEGGWTPFCRFLPRPQSPAEREAAYQRHHRARETWVTNAMVLVRCHEDEVVSFREFKLTRFGPGGKVAEPVDVPAAWARLPALAALPALPIAAVARAWAAINGRDLPAGAQAAPVAGVSASSSS